MTLLDNNTQHTQHKWCVCVCVCVWSVSQSRQLARATTIDYLERDSQARALARGACYAG